MNPTIREKSNIASVKKYNQLAYVQGSDVGRVKVKKMPMPLPLNGLQLNVVSLVVSVRGSYYPF